MEVVDKKHDIETNIDEQEYCVSINLSSTNVKRLERVCSEFYIYAKTLIPDMKGVTRLPTKKGSITTRRSPCGEGTNTWSRYKISVHSRAFSIVVYPSVLEKFASFLKSSDVEISLVIKSS